MRIASLMLMFVVGCPGWKQEELPKPCVQDTSKAFKERVSERDGWYAVAKVYEVHATRRQLIRDAAIFNKARAESLGGRP